MKPTFPAILLTALTALAGLPPQARASLPQWYLDASLPALDTDGDGIPDEWERRTFGDPAAADSGLDRDGDGLTDLEEFAFGSDPRTVSTLGDGWSDLEKHDAGLDAVCRVVPTVSSAQWLAWLGWDAQTWQTLTATNAKGFACAYAGFVYNTPPYSEETGAADFWLVTRTDRPAWLTVGDALTTNSFPVRAGTGRVRIRAAYGGPVSLTLDPLPGTLAELPGATNGPWLCEMSVLPVRPNTVLFEDGQTPPPVPGDPDSVDGLLLLAPPPSGAVHALTSPPPSVALQPLRMTDGAVVLGNGGRYCLCASEPPCDWPNYAMIGCDAVSMAMGGHTGSDPILPKADALEIFWSRFPCLECTVTQTVANAYYPFLYGRVIFSIWPCEAVGGVFGAEQKPPLHEPGYNDSTLCGGIGCTCDDGPHWIIGFDHSAVNTCFLSRHPDEPEDDKLYHHCLGVVWNNQPIDLADLCESCGLNLGTLVAWEANGTRLESSVLALGAEPPDLEPTVFRIKMLQASHPAIEWDRIILVVNNRKTKARYDKWVTQWSNPTNKIWLRELPDAFLRLGNNNTDPEPSNNAWFPPRTPGRYYHHTSAWEMRSEITEHGHGNQACYAANGTIVTSGIGAGTADYVGIGEGFDPGHVTYDVDPYIRALQLDGNPCLKDRSYLIIRGINLTHAVIYQGVNTDDYLLCRPPSAGVLLPEQN